MKRVSIAKLPQETIDGAKEMYLSGESLAEVARRYDMPRTTMGRALSLAGVEGLEQYARRKEPCKPTATMGASGYDFSQKTGRELAAILNDLEDELTRRGYYKDEKGNWYVRQYLLRESIRKGL